MRQAHGDDGSADTDARQTAAGPAAEKQGGSDVKKLLNWFVDKIIAFAKRTPYSHIGDYMERYWIIPYNKIPFLPSARIHHIKRSDDDRAFHDHPWWYLTIILRGGYWEVTPLMDLSKKTEHWYFKRTWRGPGSIIFRRHTDFHRLEVQEGQTCWTLFMTGKYKHQWGFLPRPDAPKIPHKEYLETRA
jgi:hypothetical protein